MSLEAFFAKDVWGSKVEKERRLRIKLSIAAYSYEFKDVSIVSDAEFDKMCREVDLSVDTGNELIDKYFKETFDSSTGQWIHKHPELDKIEYLYDQFYKE